MKTILSTSIVTVLLVAVASARPITIHTPSTLYEKADAVLIATVTSIKKGTNVREIQQNKNAAKVKVFEYIAQLKVQYPVKGTASKQCQLKYHNSGKNGMPSNGPCLINLAEDRAYLFYLKKTAQEGVYVGALDGLYDDDQAVKEINLPQMQNPAERGRQRAKQDIADGTMKILYYGKPWPQRDSLIDPQSLLPVEIVRGCCFTPQFVVETNAYNDAMRREASKWSRMVNGLQAKLTLRKQKSINGTTIISADLTFRNTSGTPMTIKWDNNVKMTFEAFREKAGPAGGQRQPVPKATDIAYDGSLPDMPHLTLPGNSKLTFRISRSGLGIPKGKAALIDLGPESCWIIDKKAEEQYYVKCTLTGKTKSGGPFRFWYGTINIPPARIPLEDQPDSE